MSQHDLILVSDRQPRPWRLSRVILALAVLAGMLLASRVAMAAGAENGWWLQVKNAACASGATVLLGDIAEPRGDIPAEVWKTLAAKPLWPAPEKNGHQMALTRDRLAGMLRHYLPEQVGACALPSQIVVQRGGKVFDGETLTKHTVAFLTERGKDLRGELEITDMHVPDYVFFASTHDSLDILVNSAVKPGRNNLLFEVRDTTGKSNRRYAASAFINVWRTVACATRPLNRLEQVNPDQITFLRKNMAFYPTAWDGTGGPWRATKSVGTNQVITTDGLEPVPVIAKGAKVNLIYEGSNIRLSVKAEAMGDGGVGQKVQVRNLQSNRNILATVQDAATVVVH
jgi:flagella basal body P-ring formation protein FlgA